MVRGLQTTVGWSEPAIFLVISVAIFGTFRVEANIIMSVMTVPYMLSSYLKMIDLE